MDNINPGWAIALLFCAILVGFALGCMFSGWLHRQMRKPRHIHFDLTERRDHDSRRNRI